MFNNEVELQGLALGFITEELEDKFRPTVCSWI